MRYTIMHTIFLLVIFIPWFSNQHFVPPLSDCLMADYCNHTWVPECGRLGKEGANTTIYKLFIDKCDIYEYNCDNGKKFVVVNYSECYRPIKCDDPKTFLRSGNYKIMLHERRIVYDPTTVPTPPRPTPSKKRYFFRIITEPTGQTEEKRYTTKKGKQWLRVLAKPVNPPRRRTTIKFKVVEGTNAPNKETMSKPPPRYITLTTLATTRATIILTKYTVIKDGKKYMKVIKGYAPLATTTTESMDSDFLQ